SSCELMSRTALEFVLRHVGGARDPLDAPHDWYLLVEATSSMSGDGLEPALLAMLEASLQSGVIVDAVVASSLAQRQALWHLRECMSDAQKGEGASIKHDVAVPVDRVPQLIARGIAAVTAALPGIRPCPFGHLGDGNIHFNLTRPEGMDNAAFLAPWGRFNALIHDIVADLGGSISAEHGIGQLKVDELGRYKSPVALDLMRALKKTLDPDNLMNPGKVVSSPYLEE
ncbi:MAG: FAD-linked oxidase C-terminal domain-containing protein, partial [Pseudomonadota bacterium]|nr:FAD-linked oxidase C-terminal domain-containing protein [Pseudomonadota bacterium]